MQLYINDQPVDLADDSPVALTFQINNLAEVKNQQGNTSNQFKLPLTQRNRQVLGFPDDVAFTTGLPYDNYRAKIVQDGLEIVPEGVAVLNGIEQDSAAITVLSGNVDFFDSLDVKLYDLGDSTTVPGKQKLFEKYQHTWDVATITGSQNNTEGWIWPVVDYGTVAYPADNPVIDVRQMRPGFFLKTAVELMVKLTGYRINPDSFLLKQPLYQKLIVQFANDGFQHGSDYQNSDGNLSLTDNFNGGQQVISRPRTGNESDHNGQLTFKRTVYTAPRDLKCTASVSFDLYLRGKVNSDYPATAKIFFVLANSDGQKVSEIGLQTFDLANGAHIIEKDPFSPVLGEKEFTKQKLSMDIDMTAGQKLYVGYNINLVGVNKYDTYVIIRDGASFTVNIDQKNVLYGQIIQCERIFPDITLRELLKDTLQRFGIICQTNNTTRTVTFASFRDIVDNMPVAKDWTRKCLDQGKTIAFQLGGYAQANIMKYKEDEAIRPKDLGNTQITVADKTLPSTADLFESQFAPTLNRPFVGGSIAQILKVDTANDQAATDFTISTQPRILIDQKLNLQDNNNATVKFTDGNGAHDIHVNEVISVPYFYKSNNHESLLWDYLRTEHYPELEKILQQTKKVVRYFMLTPRDILELDLLIPVYLEQDSAYYYINKIDSWRKGQPVKLELVKLG